MTRINPLREMLNNYRWNPNADSSGVVVEYRDSLCDGGRTIKPFSHVLEVIAQGIRVFGGDFVPYHRIGAVLNRETILYLNERNFHNEGN